MLVVEVSSHPSLPKFVNVAGTSASSVLIAVVYSNFSIACSSNNDPAPRRALSVGVVSCCGAAERRWPLVQCDGAALGLQVGHKRSWASQLFTSNSWPFPQRSIQIVAYGWFGLRRSVFSITSLPSLISTAMIAHHASVVNPQFPASAPRCRKYLPVVVMDVCPEIRHR